MHLNLSSDKQQATDLNPFVRSQKVRRLRRVRDVRVHYSAWRDILHTANALGGVDREQPSLVPFLHNQERDAGLVAVLQGPASALDGADLPDHHLLKLTLADAVSEVDDLLRLLVSVEDKIRPSDKTRSRGQFNKKC